MPTPTPLSSPDFVELSRRDELGILVGRWRRPVSAPELQQSYEAALQAARPTRTRYWLLDLRGRGPASEDDTHWVLTQFLPRLAKQVKGRAYLAFVVGPGQLSAEEQEAGLPMVMNDLAQVRLFATDEPALQWLAARQHHESA